MMARKSRANLVQQQANEARLQAGASPGLGEIAGKIARNPARFDYPFAIDVMIGEQIIDEVGMAIGE